MRRFLKNNAVMLLFFMSTLVVLLVAGFTHGLFTSYNEILEYHTEERLLALARSASHLATPGELEQFQTPADMEKPEYWALKQHLQDFVEESDIMYAYYLRPRDGQLEFVVDNVLDADDMDGLESDLVDMEPAPQQAFWGHATASGVGNYSIDWSGLLAAYAPVYDSEGNVYCIAGVDMSDEDIVSNRNSLQLLTAVQLFAVILALVSGSLALWMYKRKARESEAANIAKSQFLSRMSHEIRTPMNAIIGLNRMARESGDMAAVKEYLGNIDNASAHLLKLINDILDLSKIESGKMQLEAAPVELSAEIGRVEQIIAPQAMAKGLAFEVEQDPALPRRVICDATHLRQVVVNLLSNAIKFTPEGGRVLLRARLASTSGERTCIEWTVQDNGIGIDPAFLPHLFDPFEQADGTTTRIHGGTGLGLSITKQLAEMMGGEVKVDSTPGRGSTFTVTTWLPVAPDTAVPANTPALPADAGRTGAACPLDLRGLRVLLVEDQEINRMIAEDAFASLGAEVDSAENGRIGVDVFLAAPERYALIFMDIQMPEMDGYEATRCIRESGAPGAATIPIIAMTANVFREDIEKALASGMTSHVGKPFQPEQIEAAIRETLGK